MLEEISKDRQLEATIELAAELRTMAAPRASGRSDGPRAGDTFVSRRTVDFPVEWLVTEVDGEGLVRVVALDHHPFVGSRDMVLPARSPGDDGVLRLDFRAGVEASGAGAGVLYRGGDGDAGGGGSTPDSRVGKGERGGGVALGRGGGRGPGVCPLA